MRAAYLTVFGTAPQWTELADVEPEPDEALVRVDLAALNPFDLRVASGKFYIRPPLPYVPCGEGVGTVVRSGRFPAGTRVRFGAPVRPGALAELVAVADAALVPVPDDVADEVAAGLGVAGMAAWFALRRGRLAEGESVLVLGATGVAGRLAVQLAREQGAATVVGAGRDPATLEELTRLGATATVVIDGGPEAIATALAATGVAFDVIIDFVGGTPAEVALASSAAAGARFVNVGDTAGTHISIPGGILRSRNIEIYGHSNLTVPADVQAAALDSLLRHARKGVIEVPYEVWAADELAAAWRYQAGSPHRKVLVRLP